MNTKYLYTKAEEKTENEHAKDLAIINMKQSVD